MASVKLYLDTRRKRDDGTYPLLFGVSNKGSYIYIPTEMYLTAEQYDPTGGRNNTSWVRNHTFATTYNRLLIRKLQTLTEATFELMQKRRLDNKQLKQMLVNALYPVVDDGSGEHTGHLLTDMFHRFIALKSGRTREIYEWTLMRVEGYDPSIFMEDVNKDWLIGFELHLQEDSSVNTIAIHMRNVRAVFNYCIDEEMFSNYPFRKYKIKTEKTRHRALTPEQLVAFRDYPCEEHQVRYRDLFMLSFYLLGINIGDLCKLRKTDIVNNRVEYKRAKTHKMYSVLIQPEAQAIIDKYAGEEYMLWVLEDYKDYKDFLHRMNENLQNIGEVQVGKQGKKTREPLYKDITTYWARHTWATTAHKAGVSKDVISMALGHSFGVKTTDVYIDYDAEKVDQANRLVIDWINKL